jgi:hypothetical protein
MSSKIHNPFYARIRTIPESARSVNTAQVAANWLIGREIVKEERRGKGRAGYGERLLAGLAQRLKRDYGNGFSVSTLQYMRSFYTTYPSILTNQHALRVNSSGRRSTGDNPALGLILCTDKNDEVVKYTLAGGDGKKIFASRHKLHVPTEAQLATELRRELKMLRRGGPS